MDNKATFKIGKSIYSPVFCDYSDKEIVDKIVDRLGTFAKDVTEEQFYFTKKLVRDGWQICDCYYGEKDKTNKYISKLKARLNWFKFTGINSDYNKCTEKIMDEEIISNNVSDYVLYVNYGNTTIFLYDNTLEEPTMIGTFHCYDDIIRSLKHIKRSIPAKAKMLFNVNRYVDTFDDKENPILQSAFGTKYYEIDFDRLKLIAI